MDKPAIDLLLELTVTCGAAAVSGGLLGGIVWAKEKIKKLRSARKRRETLNAVRLYRKVERQVPGELTEKEFDRAIQYVIQKYGLDDRGGLRMSRQNPEYISYLIAEAVGQDRLSRGTLAIAQAERELNQKDRSTSIKNGAEIA
ncbi:MAG: hypothetical protein ACFWTN_09610 [Clostridium sp.]|jgi:hypothetical protein